jgi:hypothetical protein
MYALPPSTQWSKDMQADALKNARPGLANLDVNRYVLLKYGLGKYQINITPPSRQPVRITRGR